MLKSPARAAHCALYYEQDPRKTDADGTAHWASRAANFVIVTSRVKPGSVLARNEQVDEYFLMLPLGVAATIEASGETVHSDGESVTIVPPGASRITLESEGYAHRIFSSLVTDMVALADNATAYEGVTDVAPLVSWPEPVGGYRLRHYPLAQYARAEHPLRLFRTRNLMINPFVAPQGARDVTKLSPHSHADFEQATLLLGGDYVHHVRYPWTPDMTTWLPDEHIHLSGPSVVVFPPNVIHTTRSLGATVDGLLVDVFAPPREDFSRKPGLVCNGDEYPLPPELAALPPLTGPLRG